MSSIKLIRFLSLLSLNEIINCPIFGIFLLLNLVYTVVITCHVWYVPWRAMFILNNDDDDNNDNNDNNNNDSAVYYSKGNTHNGLPFDAAACKTNDVMRASLTTSGMLCKCLLGHRTPRSKDGMRLDHPIHVIRSNDIHMCACCKHITNVPCLNFIKNVFFFLYSMVNISSVNKIH